MKSLVLFLIVFFAQIVSAQSPSIIRGPYLQRTSENTVIVRYRTDLATSSQVSFGTVQDNLISTQAVDATIEHRVEISGLTPNTKYYYQVSTPAGLLTVNDGSYFFKTNPAVGSESQTRIWTIGDSGRGNTDAINVRNSFENYVVATGRKADLWLMLGDNAYNNGLDAEYTNTLFNIYPSILRNTVLWPTLGNHDGYAKNYVSGDIPYYSSFSLPKNAEVGGVASGTESYYSFNYANIHFICLNSYDEDRDSAGQMASWLKLDLASDHSKWKIAFWHHPPYSKGSHNSDTEIELIQMREQILPIIEDYGVDLVLTGHSHSYERSFLIDGHYGDSTTLTDEMILDGSPGSYAKPSQEVGHFGTIYTVNGVAAKASGGTLDHPAMYTSQLKLGSMVIDILGNRLDAKMIDVNGEVADQFSISKEPLSSLVVSQNIRQGSVIGALSLLTDSDRLSQILRTPKNPKKVFLDTTYQFDVPTSFYQTKINIKARKKSIRSQNFNIRYSLDGLKFKLLMKIRNYLPRRVKTFSLPSLAGKTLYVRITSTRDVRLNSSGRLILDQLSLAN